MLFKASITAKTLASEDALCEQLYIFLREYVPTRLHYESADEHEDCIQETIMYLLERFKAIDKNILPTINIEQFFYNRANSFIGGKYIRKLTAARKKNKNYTIENQYITSIDEATKSIEYIDYTLLSNIINEFNLDYNNTNILNEMAEHRLVMLGFEPSSLYDSEAIDLGEIKYAMFNSFSISVVEEYLVKSVLPEDTNGNVYE